MTVASTNSVPRQSQQSPHSSMTSVQSMYEPVVIGTGVGGRPMYMNTELPMKQPSRRISTAEGARGIDRILSTESKLSDHAAPADSELSRWLEKHSPASQGHAPSGQRPDLTSQTSVAYSIVSSFSNDSADYSKLSAVRSNDKVQTSSPSQTSRQPATSQKQSQPPPPSVADLAANLGNLVVVNPQPQPKPMPADLHQPPLKLPKPGQQQQQPGQAGRPPVAPKPKVKEVPEVMTEAKTKLYTTTSYSSLPESFRRSPDSPDYPEASIYSSAEDIPGLMEEGLEDEEAISRLEMICDFVANGESQVSVREGEIVLANIEKSTRGWLWVCVESTGVQGFVPHAYTQPYETWAV